MLDLRLENSLTPVVARWANADRKLLLPLFREVATGRVTELFGVTREPTVHRIEIDRDTLFSCCALVAHTVPAIFKRDATISSTDPISGAIIKLRISADLRLIEVDPQDSYGTLVDGERSEPLDNPRTNFCCHVKHFADAQSASEFCSEQRKRYSVPIEEFHMAAQQLFHRIWA
jgi:alkylmercury lyase